MQKLKVPARANVSRNPSGSNSIRIVFNCPVKTFWDDVCVAIREVCKCHSNYRIPIDNGGVCGRTDQGVEIKIDTLGKWLFGTPGYKGHRIFEPDFSSEKFAVIIFFPQEASKEVLEMLKTVTPLEIIEACSLWGKGNQTEWVCNRKVI